MRCISKTVLLTQIVNEFYFCSRSLLLRAYERGVREVHRTRAREQLWPGTMKARTLSFFKVKHKVTSV